MTDAYQPSSTVMDQARTEYPLLNNYDLQYKQSYGKGQGYLEFWPPNETGDENQPRPKEFDLSKPGVEVYDPRTRPIDILGDVVSHHLINEDPTIKQHYEQFQSSLQPWQQQRLQEQYQYAQKNAGEQRPYDEWAKMSGVPAYFRGYAFQQWPNANEMYTPQQVQRFDQMMGYLRGGQSKKPNLNIGRQSYGEE